MQIDNKQFTNAKVIRKNLICIPFAFNEKSNTGVNVRGDAFSVYLKNACVALCSAKYFNPECDVALVTNISSNQLPNEYVDILEKYEVLILEVQFDEFVFADNYLWSLAFYKLCILKHFSDSDYQNVCYMDTDVYVQNNLEPLWEECKQNILLYDINHGLHVDDYRSICEEFESFFGEKKYLTHFGGEFFASSVENAKIFVEILNKVYAQMLRDNFVTSKGDEFLISISASYLRDRIKNASGYIYRFWTAPGFRLVSTSYENNPVLILHLPNEKNRGMIKLFDVYIKKGIIPKNQKVWKICRLSSLSILDRIKKSIKKLIIN